MARLKKLLLLANQHITRFHKELAAKDEQLRVLLACYTRRPGHIAPPWPLGADSPGSWLCYALGASYQAAQGPIIGCDARLADTMVGF